jgi:hypothetical protein
MHGLSIHYSESNAEVMNDAEKGGKSTFNGITDKQRWRESVTVFVRASIEMSRWRLDFFAGP